VVRRSEMGKARANFEFTAINMDVIYVCNAYDNQKAFENFVNIYLKDGRNISEFK
jgi:hypothetical protein